MATPLLEIEACYLSERVRFDDVAILQCRLAASTQAAAAGDQELFGDGSASAIVSIKVECNPDDFSPSVTYRFFGRWTEYKNRHTGRSEQQFHAQTFVRAKPHGRQGIIAYLRQVPNIGQVRASKLWDSFNSDAVRVLREQPEVAASVLKLADDKAHEAAAWLVRESALEDCQIELIDVLGGRGFPKSIARKAVQEWGNRASEFISRDPYLLMQFRGCGFKRCDALYLDLGLPPGRRKRQALCAWYTLASDSEGHSWFPLDYVLAGLRGSISRAELDPPAALKLAKRARAIATIRTDGPRGEIVDQAGFLWVAEGKKARQEQTVAEHLAAASLEPAAWPMLPDDSPLSPHQIENYQRATSGGTIAILGGSPGTGKTFTAAQAIKAAIVMLGTDNIAVAAPTGKAAVRIAEAMQAYGIELRARTIHSLLGRPGQNDVTGEWTFNHHAGNPLPFRLIVLDEGSMVDTSLAAAFLAARAKGTHVLIVGDVNQLPPVGHGAPLRDMIAAGLPYGELREIRRNSGAIVQACADMRDGKPFRCSPKVDIDAGANLKLVEAHSPDAQIQKMLQALEVARGMGVDPVWDCQVLVPVNDKSPLARKKLNRVLQEALNPTPADRAGQVFRVRDKVVNTKNGYFKLVDEFAAACAFESESPADDLQSNDKGEVYVANGELAEVLHVEEKSFIARLTSPTRVVRVPMGKQRDSDGDESADGQGGDGENSDKTATGCSWDLAYALSTHKCVHPDTLVETNEGLRPIRHVGFQGMIGTPTGARTFIDRFYYESRPCLTIKTNDGQSITVTRDHKCEAWTGSQYELMQAQELQVDQFVRTALFPSLEPNQDALLPPRADEDSRCAECRIPSAMSIELAEFLGLMVADGTVFRGGVRLGKRHHEVAKRFTFLCRHLFGIENKEFETAGMLVSECCATAVRNWLYKVGGCFPKAKHVPECVLQSRQEIHAAFLRGLFEDGTVNVKNSKLDHVEWVTCFPRLDREVRAMLHRLGIICGQNSQRRKLTQLYIYGQQAKLFAEKIGFISKLKSNRLQLEAGDSTRYLVPMSREFIEANVRYMTTFQKQNLRMRGHASRHTIEQIVKAGCESAAEFLRWHHSRIESITETEGPVMCVEVPEGNRFMQNGFPWGNSQGSEWTVVIVMLDEYPGARMVCSREHLYTSISRAKKMCLLIGKLATAHGFTRKVALGRRKTFLKELIGREVAKNQ